MKRIIITTLFAVGIFWTAHVFAMDLSQARSQGIVGEKPDGYIAAVIPSAEANAIVAEVNGKRRIEYEKISKQNGQSVSVVAKIAAETIINGLAKGTMYQSPSGAWAKK